MRRALPLLLLLLFGCGFSNAMYNARRRLGDAERAAAAGQQAAARTAYAEAMERAAGEYRRHPSGENADDALYVIARARYGLGEYAAARAALERALEINRDAGVRPMLQAYLGAAELNLGSAADAAVHLDSAIAGLSNGDLKARAHLWRARARGDAALALAWDDLAHATDAGGEVASDARLYAAALAVAAADSARAVQAFEQLFADGRAARPDSVAAIVRRASAQWGAPFARALLDPPHSAWPTAARDSLAIVGAELLAIDGDTAGAIDAVLAAADRLGGGAADGARLQAARWRLATLEDRADLESVRALLLPAVTSVDVQNLLAQLRILDALLDDGQEGGRALALFAAAELARDELRAPGLARTFFLEYAARAPHAAWASKAALAARALGAEPNGRIETTSDLYVAALNGEVDAAAFAAAEESLARELAVIRREAAQVAGTSDPTVGRAVALLDSARTAAYADSMSTVCGARIESLAVEGIRADSARAACLRDDSTRFAEVLRMDTLLLRDTVAAGDSLPLRRGRAARDTIRLPLP